MRLPFLQVESDSWGRARVLAALLGCDRHRAMSLQVDLWRWALERGDGMPDGLVTGRAAAVQVAGAVEWAGSAADLASALMEAGLLAAADGGYRVRGLDRYTATFERQEADRQRKAEARRARRSKSDTQEVQETSAGSPQDVHQKSKEVRSIDVDVDVDVDVDAKQLTTPPTRARARDESAPPLQDELDAVFLELRGSAYAWSVDEQQATRRLLQLAQGDDGEIVRRWRNALSRARFPTCTGVKDLVRHWNAYAAPEAALPAFGKPDKPGGRDGLTKPPPSKGEPCAWCGQAGTEDRGGQWLCAPCVRRNDEYWSGQKAAGGTP